MIYANDQWIQLPTRDIYDTSIMMASINAAKDMYEKGMQQVKDFQKDYGDFVSPIEQDMDWYNRNVTNKVQDTINSLYDQGIDPLRSQQGRATIQRLINSIPVGTVNKMRQSAKGAEEFLRNKARLQAAGKYDQQLDDMFGGPDLNNWSTLDNGVWNRQSPLEYQTLQEFIHPSFATIKPHLLMKADVESRGQKYDPKYEYTGITEQDMRDVVDRWIPGVRNSGLYKMYREQAKQDLIRNGNIQPTEEQIDEQFVKNAITADKGIMTPLSKEADPYAMVDYKQKQEMEMEAIRFRHQQRLAAARQQRSSKGGGSEGHSHATELYTGGLQQVTGLNLEQMLSNPAAFSAQIYRNQRDQLNKFSAKDFMKSNVVYDDRGSITAMFKGKKVGNNYKMSMDDTDASRMYNAEAIYSTAYGSHKKYSNASRFSAYKAKDAKYTMSPTGNIKTVVDKDGRVRTYAEMTVDYQRYTYGPKDPSNTSSPKVYKFSQPQKARNTYWYDLNISSKARAPQIRKYVVDKNGKGSIYFGNTKVYDDLPTTIKNGKRVVDIYNEKVPPIGYFPNEWIDMSFDPKYEPEIESRDVNVGKTFGDKASRTTEDARIN